MSYESDLKDSDWELIDVIVYVGASAKIDRRELINRHIAFVLHINFIELSKINRILRHLTEANRMKFEVFVA
jgi:hypothetical protein